MAFEQWQVVVVPFPFADRTARRRRPALVVSRSDALAKRPYITREMCIRVVRQPLRTEPQRDGERARFWAVVPELGGRVLRVVTLVDRRTIHNAFPDRRFKP